MLSKNNFKERLRKTEPRKERFSIRKFSVGAASVLIGFSLWEWIKAKLLELLILHKMM